jgi:hypothetical protein
LVANTIINVVNIILNLINPYFVLKYIIVELYPIIDINNMIAAIKLGRNATSSELILLNLIYKIEKNNICIKMKIRSIYEADLTNGWHKFIYLLFIFI